MSMAQTLNLKRNVQIQVESSGQTGIEKTAIFEELNYLKLHFKDRML